MNESSLDTKQQPSQLIFKKIIEVMRDVVGIGKVNKNTSQGWKFRGIDDVYNSLHPILAKHGVFTTSKILNAKFEKVESKSGTQGTHARITYLWKWYTEDGSYIECETFGEAVDWGDKSAGKAASYAHKYALIQTLCIPTEDFTKNDPDNNTHELRASNINHNTRPPVNNATARTQNVAASSQSQHNLTEPQAKRLFGIAAGANWLVDNASTPAAKWAVLKDYLKRAFNVDHTRDLNKKDYDTFCNDIAPYGPEKAMAELDNGNDDVPDFDMTANDTMTQEQLGMVPN